MNKLNNIYIFYFLFLMSCNSNENEVTFFQNDAVNDSLKINNSANTNFNLISNIDDTSNTYCKTKSNNYEIENIDSLQTLWMWNEKSSKAIQHSEIKSFKYSKKDLFKKWGWLNTKNKKVEYIFSFDEKEYSWNGNSYFYKIKYDSVWIYTNSDILDGVDRGIISKLTQDSLAILWSTGDCDLYFAL